MYRYLLFYKPYNVLSQFSDAEHSKRDSSKERSADQLDAECQTAKHTTASDTPRSTLKEFISVPDVYPVGRLDQDSEGLMLLTNHGQLQHRLSDPKFQHPKTYWVQVDRIPTDDAINQLQRGVTIQNYRTRPAQVKRLTEEPDLPPRDPPIRFRKNVPTAWIEIVLTEGRNRQVRRMTAAVGFPTLRLVRVAIEDLHLSGLLPGQWRDLNDQETKSLLKILRR